MGEKFKRFVDNRARISPVLQGWPTNPSCRSEHLRCSEMLLTSLVIWIFTVLSLDWGIKIIWYCSFSRHWLVIGGITVLCQGPCQAMQISWDSNPEGIWSLSGCFVRDISNHGWFPSQWTAMCIPFRAMWNSHNRSQIPEYSNIPQGRRLLPSTGMIPQIINQFWTNSSETKLAEMY